MKFINYKSGMAIDALIKRSVIETEALIPQVQTIMDEVRANGDEALRRYTQKFDGANPISLVASLKEMEDAGKRISTTLKDAIELAIRNVKTFHQSQIPADVEIEVMKGVFCKQAALPIDRVGLYVPGGTAPLFSSVIMLAVPAVLAKCREIVLVTPPNKSGVIPDEILYTAMAVGLKQIYCVGGAQAIAALTYGTESVPKVDKILGPGNQFVTAAKQLAFLQSLAIDMPAGPSELAVIADESSVAKFVAADLLSQAEHGADSQVVLICTSDTKIKEIEKELGVMLETLPRKEMAFQSLNNSFVVKVQNLSEGINVANQYAPEHLILAVDRPRLLAEQITNAGSVFLGHLTPESAGDYASGTNHTLPTNGAAKAFSGVNMDAFYKKITFQQLSSEGVASLGNEVVTMAENEQLRAHANAMQLRLDFFKDSDN